MVLSISTLAIGLTECDAKPVVSDQQSSRTVSAADSTSRMEATAESNSLEPLNILAQDMTTLVKKIQDLRHLGIEDSHIALPKICVIGDQSTGKSSLIEGMSEIKVPRSAGTCTRCPMEINLSESEPGQPWTCRVYLTRRYMYDGSRKITKPKKSEPLGPWHAQDPEDELFFTTFEKGQIEEVIRWAQLAVLNPGSPTANYIPGQNSGTDPHHTHVKFSPNIVRLDISAPGFPNLSFYDLPGVINQAEHDDERYLVNLVENLVKEYICQENCIVLLTITMTDDVMNSSAARIMRDVRGAKQRALGVLTKPDRFDPRESHAQWVELLEGDKFQLGHGYYVVQNDPDPSVEHSIARQREEEFFKSGVWNDELAAYQDRFGTRCVQAFLSGLLFQQIQRCLPRIIQKIDEKAERIDAELSTLPEAPSANVPYILCGKLHTFRDQIRCHIDGGSREYPLQKLWIEIAEDFKRALAKTRPTVKLLSDSDRQSMFIATNEDSDCEIMASTPLKRKTQEEPVVSNSPDVRSRPKLPGYRTVKYFDAFDGPAKSFTWEEIREINQESASAGIPQQINPKALEFMDKICVEHWEQPMVAFVNASHKLVKRILQKEVDKVFVQYHQTELYRELQKIIDSYLQQLRTDHLVHAGELYYIERTKPFTMASSTLTRAIEDAQKTLETSRLDARKKHYLKLLNKYHEDPSRRQAEMKKLGEAELGVDNFTQELRIMAETRGYYEVASARFVDSVCQSVHTKLFFKCREELVAKIENCLGIYQENAVERCNELMAEKPERQRRRQYLVREKEKIMQAQQWLHAESSTTEDQEDTMDFEYEVKLQPFDD
ncbi:putative dynamin GTPase [Aspergillus undulatus]|uniref:putative dynamin GTPase n=1 Tax=Aspergillus undulatus TaxID=1810928 RepID=UPI003CCCB1E9